MRIADPGRPARRGRRWPPTDTDIGMSLSMMPPCIVAWVGLAVPLGHVDALDDDPVASAGWPG